MSPALPHFFISFLYSTLLSNQSERIAGIRPVLSELYMTPFDATVYLYLSKNAFNFSFDTFSPPTIYSSFLPRLKSSAFQSSILAIFVSGEMFSVIIIDGYSDVKSKSYIQSYLPGTGSLTNAPINPFSPLSRNSCIFSCLSAGLFGATTPPMCLR